MRKLLTFIAAAFITGTLLAGGLVTNTNGSASWVRLPARNASINVDAVYYNPAGLMKLENGFHVSVSNQTIFQTKKVENFYKEPGGIYGLNDGLYVGKVSAPVYPSIFAAYKMDRVAFSFGFLPVGGGGGATYDRGLPSFELSASDLVPSLKASQGATAYRLNTFFEGSSVFFGLQGGVSFKINDIVSVAAGLRYVMAKNTYDGYLKDIQIKLPSGWTRADVIMTGIAAGATGAATSTSALVAGGAGGLTLAAAQTAGIITLAQRTALEGGLTSFGAPTTVTIAQADAVFKGAAAKYTGTATLLADQSASAEQTGNGVTPILSVNISPSENLNIGIKYEFITKMVLQNKTAKDFTTGLTATGARITMFPDGELTPADMPAMISVGVDYKLSSQLKLSLGSNYFFDKNADYGHKMDLDNNSSTPSTFVKNKDIIKNNGMSLQGGLEYNISDKLLVSGGYVFANKGVNDDYQSDLTYGLATHTFGLGGAYSIMDKLQVNVGVGYTNYVKDEKWISHVFSATNTLYKAKESYYKSTMMVAIGVDFSF
jgi:long-chain fatty acid transport protein